MSLRNFITILIATLLIGCNGYKGRPDQPGKGVRMFPHSRLRFMIDHNYLRKEARSGNLSRGELEANLDLWLDEAKHLVDIAEKMARRGSKEKWKGFVQQADEIGITIDTVLDARDRIDNRNVELIAPLEAVANEPDRLKPVPSL